MIAWSVRSDQPLDELAASAADSYTVAVEAMLDTVRTDLLTRDRDTRRHAIRYLLCLDADQVAVLAVAVGADGRPDHAGALAHLDHIEHALTAAGRARGAPA